MVTCQFPNSIQDSFTCFSRRLEGKAPVYIRDPLKPKVAGNYTLTCRSFGDRAFAYSGPSLWNALPLELRRISNIDCFKRHLKTYLFVKALRTE